MTRSLSDAAESAAPPGLHPLLSQLFAAWDRGGVDWCFLRSPANPGAPESDVDLLVDPAGLETGVTLAKEYGFVRVPGQLLDVHLLTFHRETAAWLWLHCVTELRFGPHQVLSGDPASAVLRRRLPGSPAHLAPDDEFWITLAHCLLDHREIAMRHRRRLATLVPQASTGGTLARGLDELLPPGCTSAGLLRASQQEMWAVMEKLRPALIRAGIRRARPTFPRRAVKLAGRLPARLRGARLRRGIGVALLGPDGAGKSTLADGIERTFVFPVRQMYMGLTGGVLRHVDRLRIPGVVRLGRLAVIWGRYLRARYHMARGRLVVFDRYIYDSDVPTPHRLGPADRLGRWIDGRCCPAPDLIFLLDAPGGVMHQRKAEYDPETLENWRRHFLALRRRVPRIEVIDATRGIDTVRVQVIDRVWRHYSERWTTP
jgi:thymidylate kinase